MLCLGIALGYAGNLTIPQQSAIFLIVGITSVLGLVVVLARHGKYEWDDVLEVFALDLGVAAFITSRTLSAVWVIVFLCLATLFAFLSVFPQKREKLTSAHTRKSSGLLHK